MTDGLQKTWSLLRGLTCVLYALPCFSQVNSALTLMDVLHSVRLHYPQIKIAHLEIQKTHGEYIRSLGKFDPSFNFNTASLPVGGYISNYGNTEINVPTFYNGVKFFGGYRNGNGDWPIYYQNYLTNSGGEYRAGLSLPLLRDRLIDKERTGLLTQAETMRMKQQDAALTEVKVYQEAIKAYWQWVQAGFQVSAFEHLKDLAEKRQKAIVTQAHQGDLALLAITENLQQIVQREQLVNQGTMMFEQAAINLSLYYRDQTGHRLIPSPRALPAHALEKTTQAQTGFAQLKKHPALMKLENYANIIKLKKNLAENELLPNLDATAYTFKQNGTGGYPLLIPQAAMVGVLFKFPLLQREAKGKVISARNELQQITTEKKFVFDQLKNDLTNLFIGIKIYHQQVILLQQELDLALKVQDGETQKFHEGDSTLFLVNQREQTTTQVKLNWINAKVRLNELMDLSRFFSSTA